MAKKTDKIAYDLVLNANPFISMQQQMKTASKQCAEEAKKLNEELKILNDRITETAGKGEDTKGLKKQAEAIRNQMKLKKAEAELWKRESEQQYYAVDKLSKVVQEKNGIMTRSWNQLNEVVKQANKIMRNFGNETNMKKLQKELDASGFKGSVQEYQQAITNLSATAKARMAELAAGFTNVVEKVRQTGATSKEEGQRMLLALSEVRKAVDTSTADGKARMIEIDEAINKVNADMEKMAINSSDVAKALGAFDANGALKNSTTAFSGSINQMERMKASLLAWQRTIDTSVPKGRAEFQKLEIAIGKIDEKLKLGSMDASRFNEIVRNPKAGSIHELEKVIAVLEMRYKNLNQHAKEYNQTAMQLREARKQLKAMNDNMKNHVTTIDSAISRLKSYVMVYMGFNQFLNLMRSWITSNMELSDSLSDIQKRTRLSDAAIKEISKTIDSIDTRTSQAQLHELAATAGLLGLKSKEDIIGFTRAANEMSVALKELGGEGAAQLMKIATLTGDVANYGVEQALIKTGSAINELTASSAASAGPIVNFISRMGAVGSQAKLTMGDLAGIGATLDALGQPIELSATAMNRFIMALRGNTSGLATALGIDIDQMDAMMQAGKTMEAMVTVLEKMSEQKGGVAVLGQVFDEMGSEGVRLKQTISSLIGNVEFLRTQVAISNQAFEEGVSVVNEYNIKNENSAAIMERTGNMIREYFTNTDAVDSWKGIATAMYLTVKALLSMGNVIKVTLALWVSLKLNIMAAEAAQLKFNATQKSTLLGTAFRTGLLWLQRGWFVVTGNIKKARAATVALGHAQKELGMTNPYSAILTVVSTLAITFLPDLLSKIKMFNKEIDSGEKAAKRYADALDKMNAIETGQSEQERLLKMQIDYLRTLNKDSEEYIRTRDRIIAQNADELRAISERIKAFRGIGDYEKEFLDLIEDAEEQFKAGVMVEQLKAAEEAAEDALRTLRPLKQGTEEYANAMAKAKPIIEKYNELIAEMGNRYQDYANQVANRLTNLSDETLAWNLLTKAIYDNARAEIKANALREEADKRNEIFTAFRKKFVQQTTQGDSWFFRLFSGKSKQKTVSEEEATGQMGTILDYLMNPDENASMSNSLKGWLKQFNTTVTYSGGIKRDINDPEALIAETRMSLLRSLKNTKMFDKWANDLVPELTSNAPTTSGPNMKAGWNRATYEKETREILDKRSELLHLEWNKYKEGSDMEAFNKYTGQTFKNYSEATKWVKGVVKEMKDVAKGRGWALAGNWTWPTDPKSKKHQEREADSAIAELDRYYEVRKQHIEQARIDEGLSEAEYNRRMDALEQEHLQKRYDLRQSFTTKDKAFINQFRQWWAGVADLDKVNWEKIEKEWAKADSKDIEQNKLKAEKDLTAMKGITVKHLNAIADILSKERPYDTITKNLQDNLIKMEILFADLDEQNEQSVAKGGERVVSDAEYVSQAAIRTAFLLNEAERAYALTIDELLKDMEDQGFKAWADTIRKDNGMADALMAQMRDVYDKVQDAIKRETTQIKRQIDIAWNDTVLANGKSAKQLFDSIVNELGKQESSVRRANELIDAGYASEKVADKLAIRQMKVKMQQQATYIAMLRKMWQERIDAAKNAGKLEDAANIEKSRNLSLSNELLKQDELRLSLAEKLEAEENKLYVYLREWAELLTGSIQQLFEASNAGNEDYYNQRAKLMHEASKGLASATETKPYYIIENAGTADAHVVEQELTALQALEKQHEIDQQNAMAEAWRSVMDNIAQKMGDTITDQINAMMQNAAVIDNTSELSKNTEAIKELTAKAMEAVNGQPGNAAGSIDTSAGSSSLPFWQTESEQPASTPEPPEHLKRPDESEDNYLNNIWSNPNGEVQNGMSAWSLWAEECTDATKVVTDNLDTMKQKGDETNKKMQASAQSMYAKMTQAANLYGVAYQVMSNENMTATQKFGMIAIQAAGNAAITGLNIAMSETVAQTTADSPAVLSKLWKQLGWAAVPVYAIFTGLLGGLMGMAASAISKGKSEISSATGQGGGRLVTGMLTYAEGNYPVLGADGKTYNAKYEGRPETGIYSGGARFGIFSEKKPEAIIDGDTTERILLDYPKIWRDILTIKKHGRLKEAYATYAGGNAEEIAAYYKADQQAAANTVANAKGTVEVSTAELENLSEAIDTLNGILERGIGVNMLGDNGLDKSLAKRERFKKRMHIDE